MTYHYTPHRMAKIKMNDNIQFWQWCGENGSFIHCWWECKMGNILAVLNKLILKLPDNPGHSSQRNEDLYVHTKPCGETVTAVLLVIPPKWMQPRYSSAGDWLNMWYICAVKYYSAVKRSRLCHNLGEFPGIKLSAKTIQEVVYCFIIKHCWNNKIP